MKGEMKMTDPSKTPGSMAAEHPANGEQSEMARRMIASYSMCYPIPDPLVMDSGSATAISAISMRMG